MSPDIRLVAVDMDGTFLRSDDTYDRDRFARLRGILRDRGVRFVVASGNQYEQLRSFFDDPDEFGFVAENGAYVVDAGEPVFVARGEAAANEAVLDVLEGLPGLSYLVTTPGMAYVPAGRAEPAFVALMRRYHHALEVVDDVRPIAPRIFKFGLADERGVPPELADVIGEAARGAVVPVVSGHDSMDLNLPGVHKGAGLQVLLNRWGIGWEAVAAFGDSANDLEMLRLAGFPVAMAGAVPQVRDAGTIVTEANDSDGVLRQLSRWFEPSDA